MRTKLKIQKNAYIADLQKQPLEVFYNKKSVPKHFVIFTGKHLCWSLFLIKRVITKNRTPAEVLSFDYCE